MNDRELDDQLRLGIERFARRMNRRHFVTRTLRTGFAVLTSVVLGSVVAGQQAFAAGCTCTLPGGNACSGCQGGTFGGCPSGCSTCSSNDGCGNPNPCPHLTGHWSSCGCGTCGGGCVECWDCECPDCGHLCGCKSACNCCNCCSPADIALEMRRIAAEQTELAHASALPR